MASPLSLEEALKAAKALFKAAGLEVRSANEAIWRANLHELDADRATALEAFRSLYPLTDSERANVGLLLDAFGAKFDQSYKNLVAVLR